MVDIGGMGSMESDNHENLIPQSDLYMLNTNSNSTSSC